VLHDTAHELVEWEARIPSTMRTLLTSPGQLTQEYLAGRRARWIPPLRLYLICSVAFFLVTAITDAVSNEPDDEVARITVTAPDGSRELTPEGRAELAEGWPGRIFGIERIERLAANPEVLDGAFVEMFPRAMFVLLPVFALLTRTLWRRPLNYPAHLYTALHLHAAWFALFAVSAVVVHALPWTPLQAVVEAAMLIAVVAYGLRTAKRVFGDPWPRTIAKSVLVGAAYGVCLLMVSLSMLAYLVFTL
jgi:hypothetical protein